eukprot:1922090-Karenia_brevis.AAC.1
MTDEPILLQTFMPSTGHISHVQLSSTIGISNVPILPTFRNVDMHKFLAFQDHRPLRTHVMIPLEVIAVKLRRGPNSWAADSIGSQVERLRTLIVH